jgi:hypothetical protein
MSGPGSCDHLAYQEVFGWVLRQVARAVLLKSKTIGIDATTLEANAAMKSIVRRDTEESYTEYLKRLAKAAGLEATDEATLRRMDRRRKKKGSNEEWVNPHDPEAEITRLKDGRTALAYKAEHAVDMDTGAIVAVTTHGGAVGDTTSVGRDSACGRRSGCRTDRRADSGWQVQGEPEGCEGVGDRQGLSLGGCAGLSTAIGGAALHR